MSAWRSLQERILLGAAISAFALVCLVNTRLPLLPFLDGTAFAPFLRSDATATVTSDLLIGLISAYIFYVFIDLIPRHRKEKSTLQILNLLVASIVEAYEKAMVYGGETPITSVDLSIFTESNLKKHAHDIKEHVDEFKKRADEFRKRARAIKKPGNNFLKLKCAMETAHSRYPDFQHCLGLAANLSPEHALAWLVLTDKVRLLAEAYETQPVLASADYSGQADAQDNQWPQSKQDLESTLLIRVTEVMEASTGWVQLTNGAISRPLSNGPQTTSEQPVLVNEPEVLG